MDAHEVHLFDVPQMADDLVGSPVLAVRPPHEGGLTLAADSGGEILGGAGHAAQTLLQRLLGDLFQCWHVDFLSLPCGLQRQTAALLDDLIRPPQHRRRDREPQRLGGLEIDY